MTGLVTGFAAGVAIGTPEERRRVRLGAECGQPLRAHPAEALAGQGVDAVVGDRVGGQAHLVQAVAREVQVDAFLGEWVGGFVGDRIGVGAHDRPTLPGPVPVVARSSTFPARGVRP